MSPRFDADELFGEDYLYFYAGMLGDERSDEDTAAAVARAGIAPGGRLLDAPCGHGRMAVRLAQQGFAVTGVDRSTRFLEVARSEAAQLGVEVELVEGDLRALPVDGPFDAVVCWFTSYGYFDDKENQAVLEEFHRVLRPGGVLVLETLSHDAYVRSFTQTPDAIVVDVEGDLMVDRNDFDVHSGSIVCHRVTIRGAARREARFTIRLPTLPEWRRSLADAGFGSVTFSDAAGDPVDLETWRLVVRAVA
ncbi:MAG TPA: methyltransferase domain-containing protein [Acidimicrobiales bacterium]|nr:methyltransferase domain-containing protein [Acidimicrobiales bacterium]